MDADLSKITLDLAQLLVLLGLVWGLARMSFSVDALTKVTDKLTKGLESITESMGELGGRVSVLEDRTGGRRRTDVLS